MIQIAHFTSFFHIKSNILILFNQESLFLEFMFKIYQAFSWSFLFYQSLIMIWPTIYQFYNIVFMYQAFVIIDHNSKCPNNINVQWSFLWWYNTYLANKLWFAMLQYRVIFILATYLPTYPTDHSYASYLYKTNKIGSSFIVSW